MAKAAAIACVTGPKEDRQRGLDIIAILCDMGGAEPTFVRPKPPHLLCFCEAMDAIALAMHNDPIDVHPNPVVIEGAMGPLTASVAVKKSSRNAKQSVIDAVTDLFDGLKEGFQPEDMFFEPRPFLLVANDFATRRIERHRVTKKRPRSAMGAPEPAPECVRTFRNLSPFFAGMRPASSLIMEVTVSTHMGGSRSSEVSTTNARDVRMDTDLPAGTQILAAFWPPRSGHVVNSSKTMRVRLFQSRQVTVSCKKMDEPVDNCISLTFGKSGAFGKAVLYNGRMCCLYLFIPPKLVSV